MTAGNRLDDALVRLKEWMDCNNAGLRAAILILSGFVVFYNVIHEI